MATPTTIPVPVTLIGGFLGSGKTTLLNHVLSTNQAVRYAVMVNDFGSLSIDAALVRSHDGETISFANGCVCCSLGSNLLRSINALLQREPQPEQFLIELSGVANPKTIADVATLHPRLRRDLILTLADAQTVEQRHRDQRLQATLAMQLAPADLVLVNKCDLVSDTELSACCDFMRANYAGNLITTTQAELPQGILSDRELLMSQPISQLCERNFGEFVQSHQPETQFHRITLDLPPQFRHRQLLNALNNTKSSLLRAKGFVYADSSDDLLSFQLSGKQFDVRPAVITETGIRTPVLVAIGLEPLAGLEQAIFSSSGVDRISI